MATRIILHIDLDSFYAAVEELRNPALRGKRVVVCMFSGRGENSGAVATANYRARELGIHSGMAIRSAKARADSETVFLPADREHYKKVSGRVMAIFRKHADAFEQRSIDEAYLDASDCGSYRKAEELARRVKQELLTKERLTCSVGIGQNKLTAKMACRLQKPDGLTVVREGEFGKFFAEKPVEKLFGVGPKTLEVLKKHGVATIQDLSRLDTGILQKEFGETRGMLLHEHSLGRDEEPVEEVVSQQLSRIGTLPKDTRDAAKILEKLSSLAEDLYGRIRKGKVKFRTVSIITVSTFMEMRTRSSTLPGPSDRKEDILEHAERLLGVFLKEHQKDPLRRVGVRVSSFGEKPSGEKRRKQRPLSEFS